MARPQPPRSAARTGSESRAEVPRPQPDARRDPADHGDPLGRQPYIRLSQDGRGAGRGGRSQSRRPGAGRRPRRPAARLRALERPVADQPEVPVAPGRAAGPGILGPSHRRGRGLADVGPWPGPGDRCLPRCPRRGRWPQRPDRRPVRRRPLGRDLQPGHVPADRADPVAPRRSVGHGAFPRGRRRTDRTPGRLHRPPAGQFATAPPRDHPGARDPLSHPFRGIAQDRLLLRPAR